MAWSIDKYITRDYYGDAMGNAEETKMEYGMEGFGTVLNLMTAEPTCDECGGPLDEGFVEKHFKHTRGGFSGLDQQEEETVRICSDCHEEGLRDDAADRAYDAEVEDELLDAGEDF